MSAVKGVGLFKRAWHEIPEIVGSSFMALLGLCLGTAAVIKYRNKNGHIRRYKTEYTVIRPDHPNIELIRAKKEGKF